MALVGTEADPLSVITTAVVSITVIVLVAVAELSRAGELRPAGGDAEA